MNLSDFDYELPAGAIAKYPAERRESARLLVLQKSSGEIRHRIIRDLPELLRPGDLLVLNDTKVQPWRLRATRPTGGNVEVLLVRDEGEGCFQAMVKANRPLPEGEVLLFRGEREAVLGPPGLIRPIRFLSPEALSAWLEKVGEMPIPPYLERGAEPIDRERYQTVYATSPGAVAAPTAGLHLTEGLIDQLRSNGIGLAALTLHVGPGTFRPVKTERIDEHEMDPESFILTAETVERIEKTRRRGGRIVAVGTTVVRVLEAVALDCAERNGGEFLRESAGETRLFIRPGHRFLVVDAMLTNFHLPRSTLLMLVSAFADKDDVINAYREAAGEGYRFYSYGDAMLIE